MFGSVYHTNCLLKQQKEKRKELESREKEQDLRKLTI